MVPLEFSCKREIFFFTINFNRVISVVSFVFFLDTNLLSTVKTGGVIKVKVQDNVGLSFVDLSTSNRAARSPLPDTLFTTVHVFFTF